MVERASSGRGPQTLLEGLKRRQGRLAGGRAGLGGSLVGAGARNGHLSNSVSATRQTCESFRRVDELATIA